MHVLERDGVALVLEAGDAGLPQVLHWGAPVGDGESACGLGLAVGRGVSASGYDAPWPLTLLPAEPDGWEGRPAIAGARDGEILRPRWRTRAVDATPHRATVEAEADGLALTSELALEPGGVLRVRHAVRNTGDRPVQLHALEAVLPVGDTAREVLDLTGRWTREREPQRRALARGDWARESRRGRTGHDASTVLALGTPGFDAGTGEVWAVHLAWSGDAVHRHDALPEATTLLGAGPLLRPGEVALAAGESFATPDAFFVWSDTGLDGVSRRLHTMVRARPTHPRSPRPVTLNTWEAVYFDHDVDRLAALARIAAEVGVERFVLDDGWFLGRRSDDAGLGDWQVDPDVWPDGLAPLAGQVRALGMAFGLWVEPEMVSPDSVLARKHPDWLLQPAADGVRTWRQQYALDLTRPEVATYLLKAISAVVHASGATYLKWDQNRDLVEAVHAGRAALHRHTEAVYALMDALRARHPGLEIESCASGGARVDLGVLAHTDRVWASDTNDPVERVAIQRWTELLLPPELIGSHVGPARAHTTRRVTELSSRIAIALIASFGIECDLTRCTPEELAELRDGIAAYRRLRPLLHRGRVSHPETGDDGLWVTQVVADDGEHALVRLVRTTTSVRSLPPLVRVTGLRPEATYLVRPVPELRWPDTLDLAPPPWLPDGVRLSGAALGAVGVRAPFLAPAQAVVLEVVAER
ncbi:MAG TPA: alpha-galactosidase [Micrococcales bacterium]|nr:alpha-galactosidase [Micrococcales bacterium]